MIQYNNTVQLYLENMSELIHESSYRNEQAEHAGQAANPAEYTHQTRNSRPSFTYLRSLPTSRQTRRGLHTADSVNRPRTNTSPVVGNMVGNTVLREILPLFNIINTVLNTDNLQDVVVYPSGENIEQATRNVSYSSNPIAAFMNSQCPITLEQFEDGQEVSQIIHCGHTFSTNGLESWFRQNVHCPVCRYDIRTNFTASTSSDNQPSDNRERPTIDLSNVTHDPQRPSTAATNDAFNNLINIISNEYMNIMNANVISDSSYNLIYTFDIPISFTDISRNRFNHGYF
jgi:hypothetical protein